MAFSGDLEHLPIVDIIQLLHTTKKSGILTVRGEKGQSRIVFSEGHIVSANYLNGKVRIGRILVKMNAVTPEDLEEAIASQINAGENRKPLISTLLELGKIKQEEAHKGLKKLVEMTVVELVGWTSGTFTLDTEVIAVSDECRYVLDNMEQVICLDAQMILMDALRIFDEKKRDGTSADLLFTDKELTELPEEGSSREKPAEENRAAEGDLTADLLGLADVEKLEKKIPDVFKSIRIVDPAEIHRKVIGGTSADLPAGEREKFVSYLMKFSDGPDAGAGTSKKENLARGIILFSRDELLRHCIMTLFKNEGILVFSTGEAEDLDPIVDQYITKDIVPVLIFDGPESPETEFNEKKVQSLRQHKKEKYPHLVVIQLAPDSNRDFYLQSFVDGVRAVFPKPSAETDKKVFVENTIRFLETLRFYIKDYFHDSVPLPLQAAPVGDDIAGKLRDFIFSIRDLETAPEVAYSVLRFVSEMFERSMTLVVRREELLAEKSIGIKDEKSMGAAPAMKFRIPLTPPTILSEVINGGEVFFGACEDNVLQKHLFGKIGTPRSSTVLILPIRSRGKTISLTYADFGKKEPSPVKTEILEIISSQAGLVLENSLYRKQIESASLQK